MSTALQADVPTSIPASFGTKQVYTGPVRRAVVDVGSNSVLLLVAEESNGCWKSVLETSRVTGLGAGTKQSGLLSETGVSATLAELRRQFDAARSAGADCVLAAATMAARIATNTPEFLLAAEAQGTPVVVLPAEEEAQLGVDSVLLDPLWAESVRVTVLDPGGHSSEVATAEQGSTLFRCSSPVGALGVRDSMDNPETLTPLDMLQACAEVDRDIGYCYLPDRAGTAVALGATATNLVSIRAGYAEWRPDQVHGQTLGYEEVSKMAAWLCEMSQDDRGRLIGIEPGREGSLHTGALVLERLLYAVRAEECQVSVRGWRHALVEKSERFL